jgi:hypothetical protein
VPKSETLAQKSTSDALRNADSWEYYLEHP